MRSQRGQKIKKKKYFNNDSDSIIPETVRVKIAVNLRTKNSLLLSKEPLCVCVYVRE